MNPLDAELLGTPLWIWGLWALGLVLVMVAALAYFVLRQQPPQ